jgi:hypothetical protein
VNVVAVSETGKKKKRMKRMKNSDCKMTMIVISGNATVGGKEGAEK